MAAACARRLTGRILDVSLLVQLDVCGQTVRMHFDVGAGVDEGDRDLEVVTAGARCRRRTSRPTSIAC
jgi:hypothetical protein